MILPVSPSPLITRVRLSVLSPIILPITEEAVRSLPRAAVAVGAV